MSTYGFFSDIPNELREDAAFDVDSMLIAMAMDRAVADGFAPVPNTGRVEWVEVTDFEENMEPVGAFRAGDWHAKTTVEVED